MDSIAVKCSTVWINSGSGLGIWRMVWYKMIKYYWKKSFSIGLQGSLKFNNYQSKRLVQWKNMNLLSHLWPIKCTHTKKRDFKVFSRICSFLISFTLFFLCHIYVNELSSRYSLLCLSVGIGILFDLRFFLFSFFSSLGKARSLFSLQYESIKITIICHSETIKTKNNHQVQEERKHNHLIIYSLVHYYECMKNLGVSHQ